MVRMQDPRHRGGLGCQHGVVPDRIVRLPDDDAFGRVTRRDRYRVVHEAAAALLDALEADHPVDRINGHDLADTAWPGSPATRLVPHDGGAPITVTFTPFPGVMVHFGHRGSEAFPACGCDGCDERPDDVVADMEGLVSTVVAGGLTERRIRRLWQRDLSSHHLTTADGTELSRAHGELPDDAARHMPVGITRWPAWTRRAP